MAIIGGGIAGLWLLNLLSDRGYSVLLVEKEALGEQQTLASQGMIHGGIKYALSGATNAASETIKDMPSRWQDCLNGTGTLDLTDVQLLSNDYFMFSDARLSSRVTAFFGSRAVEGRVAPVDRKDYPTVFQNAGFKGLLYRLQDVVLNTGSLISVLANRYQERILQGNPRLVLDQGKLGHIEIDGVGHIKANQTIMAAGEGNGALLEQLGASITMQTRPLHQVMVTGDLPDLYAHAVSLRAADKPRVTFTTHPAEDDRVTWYLGGQLAESGVDRSEPDQVAFARKELEALFPWIHFDDCEFSTLRINRAEPSRQDASRPDTPFVESIDNNIVCWPTKLTLVPMMGDLVLPLLEEPGLPQPSLQAETASLGSAPWL